MLFINAVEYKDENATILKTPIITYLRYCDFFLSVKYFNDKGIQNNDAIIIVINDIGIN